MQPNKAFQRALRCTCTLLLAGLLVVAPATANHGEALTKSYWMEKGLTNPPRGLRERADWAYMYFNTSSGSRPVLLFTIATPATVKTVLPRVLENLQRFKSSDQQDINGQPTHMAEHTIVATTNMDAQRACDELEKKYHQVGQAGHSATGGTLS
jgi:hypothetical protein